MIKTLDKPDYPDDPEIRFVKRNSLQLNLDSEIVIESYHLKEKLRIMRRQRQISNFPPAYKAWFKQQYKM